MPVKIIGDETRSGGSKVRIAHRSSPKIYSVTLQMDYDNSLIFKNWFINDDLSGFNSFYLPAIDKVNGEMKEYRFTPNTELKWSNRAGLILEVSFELEER